MKDGKVSGKIPLEGAQVICVEEDFPTEYCFTLQTPKQTYFLSAETRAEMEQWMNDIQLAIPVDGPGPSRENIQVTLSFIPATDLIHKTSCSLVTAMDVIHGVLEMTATDIHFFVSAKQLSTSLNHPSSSLATERRHWKWSIVKIAAVYRRTFLLRNSALEIFMKDHTNFLLNFPAKETMKVLLISIQLTD